MGVLLLFTCFLMLIMLNTSKSLFSVIPNNDQTHVVKSTHAAEKEVNEKEVSEKEVSKEEIGVKVYKDSEPLPVDYFSCSSSWGGAFSPTATVQHKASSSDNKLVSFLVAVYDGSDYVRRTLETIQAQTYRPLEIIASIDESADADKSYMILKEFEEEYSKEDFQIKVYQQKDRLHWIGNINFLMSESKGDYVNFLQHDDLVPPDYIQKLAKCLDDDPQASNCFPVIKVIRETAFDNSKKENTQVKEEEIHQANIIGTEYERVDQAIVHRNAVSFRGLVRRPLHGSMKPFHLPHLYRNFYIADNVQILLHSIGGNMREVDVDYYKTYRLDSEHIKQRSQMDEKNAAKEYNAKLLHAMTSMYDSAHSYASSSELTYKKITQRIVEDMANYNLPNEGILAAFDKHITERKRVAVLGAGIQGCLMALMFQKHGYDVTLYDKSDDIMNRASAGGEGKVHLGLVYSMDHSMRTATHMMKGALRFASYVDYLVGKPVNWETLKSERFHYLLPYTSLITPAQFEDYVAGIEEIYEGMLMEDQELSYLGLRPPKLIERLETLNPLINDTFFEAEYKTAEYSVSPRVLKSTMKDALLEKSIKMVFGRRIDGVSRNEPGKDKLGKMHIVTDVSNHDFDMVVNCLWEGRDRIDRSIGIRLESGLNYRYKVGIKFPFIDELAALPSYTVANGAFGDFVRYKPDTGTYFSYYPIARLGITTNETKAMEWDEIANNNLPEGFFEYQVGEHQKAFTKWFPGLQSSFTCPRVNGGYILANGETDITDKDSTLHERADFPFLIDDGYVTVSTQKLTVAPHNAYLLEKHLFDQTYVKEM